MRFRRASRWLLLPLFLAVFTGPAQAEEIKARFSSKLVEAPLDSPYPTSIRIFLDNGSNYYVSKSYIPVLIRFLDPIKSGDLLTVTVTSGEITGIKREAGDSSATGNQGVKLTKEEIRKLASSLNAGDEVILNDVLYVVVVYDEGAETLVVHRKRAAEGEGDSSFKLTQIRQLERTKEASVFIDPIRPSNPWAEKYPIGSIVWVNKGLPNEVLGTVLSWRDEVLTLDMPHGGGNETIPAADIRTIDEAPVTALQTGTIADTDTIPENRPIIEERLGVQVLYTKPSIDWDENYYVFRGFVTSRRQTDGILEARITLQVSGRGLLLPPDREQAAVAQSKWQEGGLETYCRKEGLVCVQNPNEPDKYILAEEGVASESVSINPPPLFPGASLPFEIKTRRLKPRVEIQILLNPDKDVVAPNSREALPALTAACQHPAPGVRSAAVRALPASGHFDLFGFVVLALADPDVDVAASGCAALVEFGEKGFEAVEKLLHESAAVTVSLPRPENTPREEKVGDPHLMKVRILQVFTERNDRRADRAALPLLLAERFDLANAAEAYFLANPRAALALFFRHLDEAIYQKVLHELVVAMAYKDRSAFVQSVRTFGASVDATLLERVAKGEANDGDVARVLVAVSGKRQGDRLAETQALMGGASLKSEALGEIIDKLREDRKRSADLLSGAVVRPERGWTRFRLEARLQDILLDDPKNEPARKRLGLIYFEVAEELRSGNDGPRLAPSDFGDLIEPAVPGGTYGLLEIPAPEGWLPVTARGRKGFIRQEFVELQQSQVKVKAKDPNATRVLNYYRLAEALGAVEPERLKAAMAGFYEATGQVAYAKGNHADAYRLMGVARHLGSTDATLMRRRLVAYSHLSPFVAGGALLASIGLLLSLVYFTLVQVAIRRDA